MTVAVPLPGEYHRHAAGGSTDQAVLRTFHHIAAGIDSLVRAARDPGAPRCRGQTPSRPCSDIRIHG